MSDQPKCGEYRDATAEELAIFHRPQACICTAPDQHTVVKNEHFHIPELAVAAPLDILRESIESIRQERDSKYGIA